MRDTNAVEQIYGASYSGTEVPSPQKRIANPASWVWPRGSSVQLGLTVQVTSCIIAPKPHSVYHLLLPQSCQLSSRDRYVTGEVCSQMPQSRHQNDTGKLLPTIYSTILCRRLSTSESGHLFSFGYGPNAPEISHNIWYNTSRNRKESSHPRP